MKIKVKRKPQVQRVVTRKQYLRTPGIDIYGSKYDNFEYCGSLLAGLLI